MKKITIIINMIMRHNYSIYIIYLQISEVHIFHKIDTLTYGNSISIPFQEKSTAFYRALIKTIFQSRVK